jgi:hypothetical protein
MTWIMLGGLAWVLVALVVAVVLGRAVRLADREGAPADWLDEVDRFLRGDARTTGV